MRELKTMAKQRDGSRAMIGSDSRPTMGMKAEVPNPVNPVNPV